MNLSEDICLEPATGDGAVAGAGPWAAYLRLRNLLGSQAGAGSCDNATNRTNSPQRISILPLTTLPAKVT